MGKASLYECCIAVNKAQKIQKLVKLYSPDILSIRYNAFWPSCIINFGRMHKNRARAILNECYSLAANLEEYRKRVKENL